MPSQYLVLDPARLGRIVDSLTEVLPNLYDFDAIAFCGMSGAIIIPAVAIKLNKDVLMVRKDSDKSHSIFRVEGALKSKKYIIVDDFVVDGSTVLNMAEKISHYTSSELVGIFMYNQPDKHTLQMVANRLGVPAAHAMLG